MKSDVSLKKKITSAIILSNWLGKKVLPNNFVAYNNNFNRQVLQSKQYLIEQVPLKMDKLTQIEAINKTYYCFICQAIKHHKSENCLNYLICLKCYKNGHTKSSCTKFYPKPA